MGFRHQVHEIMQIQSQTSPVAIIDPECGQGWARKCAIASKVAITEIVQTTRQVSYRLLGGRGDQHACVQHALTNHQHYTCLAEQTSSC